MSKIPRKPASPPAESPVDSRYFDERDLESELRRTFQVCHECRMCVGYCGSFPELFRRVDRDIEKGRAEGAEALDADDFRAVVEECWQCKLCYIKCPYTKDDSASELLDFPRLMARAKAVDAKRNGVKLVDRILGEPQLVSNMGSGFAAGMTNLVHASRLVRKVQEKIAGISSEFPIPPMATQTFPAWFAQHTSDPDAESDVDAGSDQVVLFATCYGDFNTPTIAVAAVKVLEHNGLRVVLPGGERGSAATCCGMPNLDGGDVDAFKRKIEHNVALLYEQAKAGLPILVPSPTCSYTMKREWPEYVPTEQVKTVAAATRDLMEYLVSLGKQKKLKLEFKKELGNVAYHAPCHLRAQKIGVPGQRVLSKIPKTEVRVIEECSAVDGTWGMKAEHYAMGRKYAQKLVRSVDEAEPSLIVTDCTLSALRLAHEVKRKKVRVVHPIEALAEAYGLGDADGHHGITAEQAP